MIDQYLQKKSQKFLIKIAKKIFKLGIRANQMTGIGLFFGLLAFIFLTQKLFLVAIVFILLNRFADVLDGVLARLAKPSDRGGFIDIVFDFLFYSCIPLGFAFAYPEQNALAASVLIYSFIGTGTSFLAFAVIAEKRNIKSLNYSNKSFYYLGGLTESFETVLVFLLMCLLPKYFIYFAYSFAALCLISTGLRIYTGWVRFSD